MADGQDPPILNLTPDEKRAYSQLFQQADTDRLGVVTGEIAVKFFEKTKLAPSVLGEIWQLSDTENRGLLTKAGFCVALRLIAHYQAGRDPTPDLAFKPAPLPRFEGISLPPSSPSVPNAPPNALQPQGSGIRIPPIVPEKVAQYSSLFERSGAQNGVLAGDQAKAIFERAGLPNEVLGRIWGLSDREQKGGLDMTEFIIAMHLITSYKSRTMTAVPSALPPGLYEAAARRGQPVPRPGPPTAVPRQFTGPQRTSSPLARPPYGTPPPPQSAQTTGANWLVTPQEKAKYDQFFDGIDTGRTGQLSGEQAVKFFNDSGLNEESLASIWDLADIRSEGYLNKEEFAVAMYLIRQQRSGAQLPAFLPAALVPPSMRSLPQGAAQQVPAQAGAAFGDMGVNTPQQASKSAADDLFGLDSSPVRAAPAPSQTVQTTGGSATGRSPFDGDPFAGAGDKSPTTAAAPQFNGPSTAANMFRPFQPTSAFGASLASQGTGGSFSSSQPQARSVQQPQGPSNDDLLGDNDEEQSKKLTDETTELANMSTQVGNLRTQMQDVQGKRSTNEREVSQASAQKQELQQRLAQFRAQYEQEVQAVKSLEQQLATSRNETQKFQQELAMVEGTHQDLQTQHNQISQALEADRAENANLKSRISQLNSEVSQLKPQIEKMKSEARQQKGMVAINKKQLATNESERDKLNTEVNDLKKSQELERNRSATGSPIPPASSAVSPAPSGNTNPFFRQNSQPTLSRDGVQSPTGFLNSAPSPSAFDALFGPAAAKQAERPTSPPAVSFSRPEEAVPSGRPTPSQSPPPVVRSMSPQGDAPPPPESRQFTPGMLPIHPPRSTSPSATSSTKAMPPASAVDGHPGIRPDTTGGSTNAFAPLPFEAQQPSASESTRDETGSPEGPMSATSLAPDAIPGAFPADVSPQKAVAPVQPFAPPSNADFDAAFADFGKPATSNDGNADVFGPRGGAAKAGDDFYPMTEPAEDSSSDEEDEHGFGDNFGTPTPKTNGKQVADESRTVAEESSASATTQPSEDPPNVNSQQSPPPYEPKANGKPNFPDEFDGLLPSRDDPTASPHLHSVPSNDKDVETPGTISNISGFPSSATSDVFQDASSRPLSTWTDAPSASAPKEDPSTATTPTAPKSKNAFNDDAFADFDDLSEAKADNNAEEKFDFGDNASVSEFNPNFDSPAASMTTAGMASSQQTPIPVGNGFATDAFASTDRSIEDAFAARSGSGASGTPAAAAGGGSGEKHDWDAIFSGLGDSTPQTGGTIAMGGEATPKATSPVAADRPDLARAVTTEHDDPILKRLTGMGYSRAKALDALEKYDYDINKAVDHLTSAA